MLDKKIEEARVAIRAQLDTTDNPREILKSPAIKDLYAQLSELPNEEKAEAGKRINDFKNEVISWVHEATSSESESSVESIDITAPWSANVPGDQTANPLPPSQGSTHPLHQEIEHICDIYRRMGFVVEESREIDDDYHMFTSLNFPEDHPARDDYDTFMTDEGLVAPAHTSTMQNRVLKKFAANLENNEPIAVIVPDRVFRNEDLDATHEHTFYQVEGVFVGKDVTVGNLIATLSAFMTEYFGEELKTKLQPFYFPFTEPSFEFAIERPEILKKDDSEEQKWLELLGCGMIHPNVLREAGIDPEVYSGFAWGNGIERMVMMKHGIEDVRHFESANLQFLRQF